MGWTKAALSNPVATLVAVLLVILFGSLSLERLPIQLTPEVEKPEITIRTDWRAAAPEEVEAEIIEPQEKVLRGLPGMTEMLSKAQRGQGEITISFAVGHDLGRGLLEVLNRLNRVARYPDDADEPVISTVGGRSRAIAWFILKPVDGNGRDIQSYQDYVEEVVQTRFERVPGVALSEVRGGREREVRITFDPYRAASLGVELPQAATLAGRNEDVSAGEANVGKRRFTLRFTGAFDAKQLGELVLDWRDGRPVMLRDIADIDVRMVDRKSFVITKGERAMAVNAHREIGVNVLDVMKGLAAGGGGASRGTAETRPAFLRAGLRRDRLHLSLHRDAEQQSGARHLSRHRRAVVVPEEIPRHPDCRHRHTGVDTVRVPRSRQHRAHSERDLAGRARVRRRHDPGRRHRRSREHRALARERRARTAGGAQRSDPGVGRAACFHRNYRRHLSAGGVSRGRGRPAVRRPRAHHCLRGGRLAAVLAHRDPDGGAVLAQPRRTQGQPRRLVAGHDPRDYPSHGHAASPRAVDHSAHQCSAGIERVAHAQGGLSARGQPQPGLRLHHSAARRQHRPHREGDG